MDFFQKYHDLFETKDYKKFDEALEDALQYEAEISTILGSLQEIRNLKNRFPHFKGKYGHCNKIISEIIKAKESLTTIQQKVQWIKKCSAANRVI
jgi:hypothetical protein